MQEDVSVGDYVELGVAHVGTVRGTVQAIELFTVVLLTPQTFADQTTTTTVVRKNVATWSVLRKAA